MATDWLPSLPDLRQRLRDLSRAEPAGAWREVAALATSRLDFIATNSLDSIVARLPQTAEGRPGTQLRLAVLGSSTLAHLVPAIRVAGLRRGLDIVVHQGEYGLYWQELSDPSSELYQFAPQAVLFAFDAAHLAGRVHAAMGPEQVERAVAEVREQVLACWRLARDELGAPTILQQTVLPVQPALLGNNEHRLAGSRVGFVRRLNAELRGLADGAGVDLVAIDDQAARDGLAAWHDPGLWHRAKQEVSPAVAPLYGELVARILAARGGRSYKCLVMDLDNTLWGGVVGDDGLEGLVLGQGSALGEAYAAFQDYARELGRRGVILAVCSKNDEANAREPFEKHPEMVLRAGDIACFAANWSDKPGNLRSIARELNIGLDSLVFVDDNPFERDLVRRELPMVAVPEIGDDPTVFPAILAAAGYFESVSVTEEDRLRGAQYQGNRARAALQSSATDLPSYLRGLDMHLVARAFDPIGLQRVVQLINKTNQFNLTTRRVTEADILEVMQDTRSFGLQLRLLDRFGDNGIIAVIIGRMQDASDLLIDTWLMSCRVLGRQVEPTTLNLIAEEALRLGAERLIGEYRPTKKNAMVQDHYAKLGFEAAGTDAEGVARWVLDLRSFVPAETFIDVQKG